MKRNFIPFRAARAFAALRPSQVKGEEKFIPFRRKGVGEKRRGDAEAAKGHPQC
jgi:hypothetical protein